MQGTLKWEFIIHPQFPLNFCSISVPFLFCFCSISVQFPFNFRSIFVQFLFNSCSIYVSFLFNVCSISIQNSIQILFKWTGMEWKLNKKHQMSWPIDLLKFARKFLGKGLHASCWMLLVKFLKSVFLKKRTYLTQSIDP